MKMNKVINIILIVISLIIAIKIGPWVESLFEIRVIDFSLPIKITGSGKIEDNSIYLISAGNPQSAQKVENLEECKSKVKESKLPSICVSDKQWYEFLEKAK